ncbi:hypothetical protein FRB99_001384 [Tulasnella sp. 403]|nr:hypothetical protein FRB99_001384 [Tulasnella sp. 403]
MANPQASLLWPHYAAVGAVAFALVAGLFRFLVLALTSLSPLHDPIATDIDAQDPLKCSALLNEGQWLDRQFKNWQPEGCMLYNYQPKDVVACMPGKRVLFAGDSVARQLFFAFAHLSDPSLPYEPPQDNKKHSDYHLHSPEGDINFEFIWDPFLNTSKITTMLNTGNEHKQFDPWIFTGLCLVALAAGLGTLRAKDQEMGFLNREQTDEWKGWMQLAILIYHYLGASKTSGIYNVIRVLVASYLWMTGYGHFHYYYKKADYGILRLAQVLVRLNILTVVLAYVMNTDYMFYYFAPLVSFWYLVIYCTMAFGYKYNDNTPFVIIKLFFSSATITYIFKSQWIVELAFELLSRFCAIHWDAREWMFRVRLDLWIVYIGMFSALVTIKTQQNNWTDHPRWPAVLKGAVGGALLVLVWYFYFELTQPNKFVYNTWHPYISWAPITAYIILRNATPILRSSSSRAFVFIGRCSLETFVMQYHFWMTGDTKGILMVLPLGTAWRTVNMIVSTTGFIYLCHQAAEATGWLTNWVCTTPPVSSLPGGVRKWVPLSPPVTTSSQNGTANGRIEEIIPMLPTNANKSLEDIHPTLPQTHATSSTPKSANTTRAPSSSPPTQTQPPPPPTPPPRPHVSIPPPPSSTVIRPHPRWLERLIEHPDSPGPGWSPYIATRNRVFSAWSDANTTTTAMSVSSGGMGLGLKGIVVLACLWVLNLLWPSVGG